MIDFESINVWGAVAAALAQFALGVLWFSPALFGRQWSESVKASAGEPGSPVVAFSLFLLSSVGVAFLVALLFSAAGFDTTGKGLAGGLLLAGIVFLSILSDGAFSGHLRHRWWWIRLAYRVVGTLLLCAVVGASAPRSPTGQVRDAVEQAGRGLEQGLRDLGK